MVREVAHARKRNPLSNLNKILDGGRYSRRNHLYQFWWRSVKRLMGGGGSKFALLYWLWSSPLQHSRTTVRVCDLWRQKTRIPDLSCGIVYAILHLTLSTEHWLVTDWHTTTAYTALAWRRAVKTVNASVLATMDIEGATVWNFSDFGAAIPLWRLIMAALRSTCGHYIFVLFLSFFFLSFFLSFFYFPRLISAVADWMSTIILHMVWP